MEPSEEIRRVVHRWMTAIAECSAESTRGVADGDVELKRLEETNRPLAVGLR